jgi:ATP-dependent helicase/nuclease subunit B
VRIVFDPAFDRSVWRGETANAREAIAGEAWVGAAGLLGLLETQLGLGGPAFPDVERAAALVPVLRSTEGFWSRSFENDALATAGTLLHWRDTLCIHGWQGQPVSPRLKQLAAVTKNVLPGYPDRLRAVLSALATQDVDIEDICRYSPTDDLPGLWTAVFAAMEARGTDIADIAYMEAPAKGNLLAAREKGFVPASRDDSLQFFEASGPLEAAERVAAWIAGLKDFSGVLIVGGDAVLDAALHRYGLPTTGGVNTTQDDTLLQVLPLVLAAGWAPPDPQRVLELLTLPRNPVPRGLARLLDRALHGCPAVGSETWNTAMQEGLAKIEDKEERARVAERMRVLFASPVPHKGKYPAAEVARRIAMLRTWLQGCRSGEDADTAPWDAAISQCTTVDHLIQRAQLKELGAAQLQRVVEDATAQVSGSSMFPAEAGLPRVHAPEAVAGPAECIIWWQFTDASVAGLSQLPFTRAEKDALAAAGVVLPDPASMAVARAARWRRPLLNATRRLILVCPERGPDGGTQNPHPLWDEILANLSDPSRPELAAVLKRRELAPASSRPIKRRKLFPLPQAQREWHTALPIAPRGTESPSSAGTLLGCPLKWTLQYPGRIRGGSSAVLSEGNTLYGTLVHDIIARLLDEKPGSAADGEKRAGKMFDTLGPKLATPLFLPGAEALRASVRRVTALAARDLVERLRKWGAGVVASEKQYEGVGLGASLVGKPDLVIDSPLRIIDFKWGGASYRRDLLAHGGEYQLAVYSRLAAGKAKLLPVAYYILESRRLITADPDAFPGAEVVTGPDLEAVWEGLDRAHAVRRKELKAGDVLAAGFAESEEAEPPTSDALTEDGLLAVAPPCYFCDFAGLCGRDFPEAQP